MLEVLNHGRKIRAYVPIYKYSSLEHHLTNMSGVLGVDLVNRETEAVSLKNLVRDFMTVFPTVAEVSEDGGSGIVVTDVFTFDDDPCTVVFFDGTEQRVVKSVKLPSPVAGFLLTTSFNSFAQIMVVTSDSDNIMGLHVIKLSKSNKKETIVRKYSLGCVLGNAGVSDSCVTAKDANVNNYYLDKTYTNSFEYWLESSCNDFILNNNAIGIRAVHILKHKDFDESVIMVNQTRADFRKSKATVDPGILENATTNYVNTFSYTVNSKKIMYKSYQSGCAVVIDNHKLVFLTKRAAPDSQHLVWNPLCVMYFEMPGVLDFCFNNDRLYLAVNDNQIYVYDNFQSFYSTCYQHKNVQAMANKLPGASQQPHGYKGCLNDAEGFLMPAPSYVINIADMFQDDQVVYMTDLFFSGAKEIFTFCTCSLRKGNTFYVMSEGKIVFKKSFKHRIVKVSGACNGYEVSAIAIQNSRQRNFKLSISMLFTVELETGSLIRFEVDMNSKPTTDMPTMVSGNGTGRFLDF